MWSARFPPGWPLAGPPPAARGRGFRRESWPPWPKIRRWRPAWAPRPHPALTPPPPAGVASRGGVRIAFRAAEGGGFRRGARCRAFPWTSGGSTASHRELLPQRTFNGWGTSASAPLFNHTLSSPPTVLVGFFLLPPHVCVGGMGNTNNYLATEIARRNFTRKFLSRKLPE